MQIEPTPTSEDAITEEILCLCRYDLLHALTQHDRAVKAERDIISILSDRAGWEQFGRGCVFNGRNATHNLEAMRLTIALYNHTHGDVLPVIA
jgi:hypothetical protein